jgi:hypothetical protein
MYAAARPFVTGGIALVGASVIAVSPIAPPLPDLHLPNPAQITAATELAAFVNPIATLVDVITASVNNLATTGGQILADPFPVLQQVFANQLGIATTLGTAAQGIINAIATSTFPASLQTAFGQLAQGDITGAVETFNTALTIAGIGLLTPLQPVLSIPSVMAQNMLNVANTLPNIVLTLGLGLLSNVESVTVQMGADAQAFVDAIGAGDVVTALSTVLNAPIDVTGAFLNGIASGNVGFLSPNFGLLNTLAVAIPKMIATALGLGAPTASTPDAALKAALKSAAALPATTAKTVTLAVPAQTKAPAAKGLASVAAAGSATSSSAAPTTTKAGATGAKNSKAAGGSATSHSDHTGKHAAKSGSHK